jgi:PIN domain nuclease of toxin-antitoxin system
VANISVFDTSAILAVIFDEAGGDIVLPLLRDGLVSSVNMAEAHTILLLRGSGPGFAWSRLLAFGFEICPFSEKQARTAAELVGITRRYGLSLGDRACLALALERKATVYTTDTAWKNLSLGVDIEVIR